MVIGRSEDRDNPWDRLVLRHHCSVWNPIRVTHLGQRSNRPHSKGRTYDRNRPDRRSCTALASRGPSTYAGPGKAADKPAVDDLAITDRQQEEGPLEGLPRTRIRGRLGIRGRDEGTEL